MKRINKKVILLAVSLVLILSATIGGTVAYLIDQTKSITNTFTPADVPPRIDENFPNNSVKNNVQITNTGDIPAYIRVKVVVTWKKGNDVYGVAPKAGEDYSWTIPVNTDWVKGSDDFYYYTKPVPAGKSTSVLLTDCKLKDGVEAPEGYSLSVDIHAQSIQAEPSTAVTSAWSKVTAVGEDGTLTVEQ